MRRDSEYGPLLNRWLQAGARGTIGSTQNATRGLTGRFLRPQARSGPILTFHVRNCRLLNLLSSFWNGTAYTSSANKQGVTKRAIAFGPGSGKNAAREAPSEPTSEAPLKARTMKR